MIRHLTLTAFASVAKPKKLNEFDIQKSYASLTNSSQLEIITIFHNGKNWPGLAHYIKSLKRNHNVKSIFSLIIWTYLVLELQQLPNTTKVTSFLVICMWLATFCKYYTGWYKKTYYFWRRFGAEEKVFFKRFLFCWMGKGLT